MPPVRVATWNVHGCVGAGGDFDPARTAAIIRQLDPDIVALQEVDTWSRAATTFDGFAFFSGCAGPHAIEARALSDRRGDYGHMVASRHALARSQTYDITFYRREPRMILETYVALPGGDLRVIAAHFGLRSRERSRQTAVLQTILERDLETPAILLGDFNEWWPRGAVYRTVAPLFGNPGAPATFPARRPLFALDRVWCRPAGLVDRVWVAADARKASDHLPLVADLAWN